MPTWRPPRFRACRLSRCLRCSQRSRRGVAAPPQTAGPAESWTSRQPHPPAKAATAGLARGRRWARVWRRRGQHEANTQLGRAHRRPVPHRSCQRRRPGVRNTRMRARLTMIRCMACSAAIARWASSTDAICTNACVPYTHKSRIAPYGANISRSSCRKRRTAYNVSNVAQTLAWNTTHHKRLLRIQLPPVVDAGANKYGVRGIAWAVHGV